ncbi:hypothetical protein Tco_0788274 [Tanacetum coccineum]
MVDLIYVDGMDSHQLRMKVFPLLLADNAQKWWMIEGDGKITSWKELVEKFFCRFYPESYDGEDEMLDEGDNWGIDPHDFLSSIHTTFKNHKKVDGRTQKVIFYAWMNESWNKRYVNNNISSTNKWMKSKNENQPNSTTDSFFKAYDAQDVDKKNGQGKMKLNDNNVDDERPHKKICKSKKFEAIKYSLGPNEEYLALRSYEYHI